MQQASATRLWPHRHALDSTNPAPHLRPSPAPGHPASWPGSAAAMPRGCGPRCRAPSQTWPARQGSAAAGAPAPPHSTPPPAAMGPAPGLGSPQQARQRRAGCHPRQRAPGRWSSGAASGSPAASGMRRAAVRRSCGYARATAAACPASARRAAGTGRGRTRAAGWPRPARTPRTCAVAPDSLSNGIVVAAAALPLRLYQESETAA